MSVIVPVYKAESYLHKCVDSLLKQTLADFEILLIDDGSPDRSGEICDAYAKCDTRVRVLHQPNGGVSVARQRGLEMAVGEYVIHADPDDWVEPAMLQALYSKSVAEDADMVICDFYANYGEKQEYITQQPDGLSHWMVLRNLFQHLHGSCCNKLVRRECLNRYMVTFNTELSFCEDLYFNASLLLFPIKIAYLPQAFYHYEQVVNVNSLVNNYTKRSFEYDVNLRKKFCELLYNTEAYEVCKRRMSFLIVSRAYDGKVFTSKEFRKHCLPYCKEAIATVSTILKAQYYVACHGFYVLAMHIFPTIISMRLLLTGKSKDY